MFERIEEKRRFVLVLFRFGSNASRTLSLDKIYNILMALKHGHSWTDAFHAIP